MSPAAVTLASDDASPSAHAETLADYTAVAGRGTTVSEQCKEKAKKAKKEVEKGTTSIH